ncbi:uncharacterized protein LOC110099132 [Dendrobium catenatum]|uniref:uncharacterized protein LOC110099132 n=1 Tax=Dendrobium catenatum TaxID=906689 RepID=UPI00109FB48C|nr:uncharacterized protein LOC110099132 [Dendrobium catenatum]
MPQIQKKMSIRFARSLSFPLPTAAKSRSAFHHRSLTLPPRLHPLVAQIDTDIQSLRSWQQNPNSSSWIADGLSRIDHLHSSFSDLLNHPQSQTLLRLRRSIWADRLLEDSLRFADAHGCFRSAIIALHDHLSAAHAAVRRRDDAALASASREQKKTEKQLLRLAADARSIGRSGIALSSANAELAGVAHEVILGNIFKPLKLKLKPQVTVATAAASAAVFAGIAMLASAAVAGLSAAGLSPKCVVGTMLWRSAAFKKRVEEEGERWREKAMEKMEAVEKSISELEVWSHRVFRRMLNTRVFLLNAQTPILENEIFLR